MLETRAQRVVVLVLLLGVYVGLMLWFGTVQPDPRLGYYAGNDEVVVDADSYVGEPVQVSGTVVETDPVVIFVEYDTWDGNRYRSGGARFQVTGAVESMTRGQAVQIYGTVQPDGTIRALRSVVVPVHDFLYMYTVSFLAGLWVLARIARGWTVVPSEFALRRRSRPIRVVDAVRRRVRAEGSADA